MDSSKNGTIALVPAAALATVRCRRNSGLRPHPNWNIGFWPPAKSGKCNGGIRVQYYLFNNQVQRTLEQHLAAGFAHHDRVSEKSDLE